MPINFPIVDAHHHFWDPHTNYHPWLRDEPPIAFRYGDYRALKRRYLAPEYFADAAPLKVAATVYIETEWDPADAAGEMRYVDQLRRESGFPTVAIAQAWLDRPSSTAVLEQYAAWPAASSAALSSFVRGICAKPRNWLSSSPARRSCSITPACRLIAVQRVSRGGSRPCKGSLPAPTWR